MGRLIDRGKRERARQQRTARKQRILEEARSIFERMPFVEVTLDHVGQRAGVERGVTSMYFGTIGGLFLVVLREELESWYAALSEELDRRGNKQGTDGLAAVLSHDLTQRRLLARLLSLVPVVFEQNLEPIDVYRFQRWRHDRMSSVGAALEQAGGLRSGAGFHLLYLAQLAAAGLEPAANPRGAAAFDRADPDLAGLIVNLEEELTALLSGFLRYAHSGV